MRRGLLIVACGLTLAGAVPAAAASPPTDPASVPAASGPRIVVTPAVAPPGTVVTVRGTGFLAETSAQLYLDRRPVAEVPTWMDGRLSAALRVPAGLHPGTHWVSAVESATDRLAQDWLVVRSDWPMLRRGPGHAGSNRLEAVLGPSNVNRLRKQWRGNLGAMSNSSVAVAGGVVYAGSHSGRLFAFRVDCATHGRECTPLWTGQTGGIINWPSPAVSHGEVIVPSSDGFVYAFKVGCRTDGGACKPLWRGRTGDDIGYSSPVIKDGRVFVAANNGTLYAFRTHCATDGRTCAPIWRGPTGAGNGFSQPAVADGLVFVGSGDGKLYAFEVDCATGNRTCEPAWTVQTGGETWTAPAIWRGILFFTSYDGSLYAYRISCIKGGGSCSALWTATFGSHPSALGLAVAAGVVYVSTAADGVLHAFAAGCRTDGGACTPLWSGKVASTVSAGPAVANGLVFSGGTPDRVVAFRVGCATRGGTCAPLWVGHGGWAISSPAVVDGAVYVTSNDGYLYAFSLDGARSLVSIPRPALEELEP